MPLMAGDLIETVPKGEYIPVEFFWPVARVMARVYRLKGKVEE